MADLWGVLQECEVFARGQEALAAAVGCSEFEISAALRILERAGLVELQAPGQGAHTIQVLDDAPAQLHSRSARALLETLRAEAGAGGHGLHPALGRWGPGSAWRTRSCAGRWRHWSGPGSVQVRRPFAGRGIRALQRVPFHALDLSLERVRRQEKRALLLLRRMTDYAYAKSCRRAFLLSYFGEDTEPLACGGLRRVLRRAHHRPRHPAAGAPPLGRRRLQGPGPGGRRDRSTTTPPRRSAASGAISRATWTSRPSSSSPIAP